VPRIRTLKPEFWSDEKLSPLPPIDRLVFLGLISLSDDAGRLLDNVKAIDGFVFPETEDSAKKSLELLAGLGRIIRYRSTSGQKLIQIANWHRHQKIDKPSKYTLPGPATAGADPADIIAGVERFRAFCDAAGKTGTELVMQAVRFFGSEDEWGQAWEFTAPPKRLTAEEQRWNDEAIREGAKQAAVVEEDNLRFLAPIIAVHEKIYGVGSFAVICDRFVKAWFPLIEAHGVEKCADHWRFSQNYENDKDHRFNTIEYVASHFAEFNPSAVAA
jgi:hypothetical protein